MSDANDVVSQRTVQKLILSYLMMLTVKVQAENTFSFVEQFEI